MSTIGPNSSTWAYLDNPSNSTWAYYDDPAFSEGVYPTVNPLFILNGFLHFKDYIIDYWEYDFPFIDVYRIKLSQIESVFHVSSQEDPTAIIFLDFNGFDVFGINRGK